MSSRQLSPTFAPPATRFLASSAEVAAAQAAVFGAPLDLTESFRSGAHAGPSAVRHVSDVLETYSPVLDADLEGVRLVDLGDVPLDRLAIGDALDRIAQSMAYAVSAAQLAVMVGGEHTASLGGFRGFRQVYGDGVLVQVDAHLDMRADDEGERFTHATWLHRAGEEFGFPSIHQVGLRSGERTEWVFAREHNARVTSELSLRHDALGARPVYLSIDIDVLDPAYAPGTGCPEPGGFTFRELAEFLYSLKGLNVRTMDVMEVAPQVDAANITAAAAAKLIREAILLFATRP
ncbi:MAG TPA: agmatinase [Chloroflexota bacterium]|nr:agmatinase [Chloroflexota bacterium]